MPDDGTVQAGATLNYRDNGDGTITDKNTGLVWEKKINDGGLHDKDNTYPWSGDGSTDTIWDWLAAVNAEGGSGFAGHNDWRIPNVKELQSIVNYEVYNPAVDPGFNTATACGGFCTALTCSCTQVFDYWSSSTDVADPTFAWFVNLFSGFVFSDAKGTANVVRAVRGGCL